MKVFFIIAGLMGGYVAILACALLLFIKLTERDD